MNSAAMLYAQGLRTDCEREDGVLESWHAPRQIPAGLAGRKRGGFGQLDRRFCRGPIENAVSASEQEDTVIELLDALQLERQKEAAKLLDDWQADSWCHDYVRGGWNDDWDDWGEDLYDRLPSPPKSGLFGKLVGESVYRAPTRNEFLDPDYEVDPFPPGDLKADRREAAAEERESHDYRLRPRERRVTRKLRAEPRWKKLGTKIYSWRKWDRIRKNQGRKCRSFRDAA